LTERPLPALPPSRTLGPPKALHALPAGPVVARARDLRVR
jgi:hypothetical protein